MHQAPIPKPAEVPPSHATPKSGGDVAAVQLNAADGKDIFRKESRDNLEVKASSPSTVMPKLNVNSPNDRFEKEADSMADKVVGTGTPPLQRKAETPTIQRKGEGVPTINSDTQTAIQNPSGGQAMSSQVQNYMENRFQADFSQVRIHNDSNAATLSNRLGAQAFTRQNNIFFSSNAYNPESSSGKHLLAHELTHTIQQGGAVQRKATVSETTMPMVQRWGAKDVLGFFGKAAYNIPGYRMFCIVLGKNPISQEAESRSAANILRAVVEFLPGGAIISSVLDKYGVLEKAGAFVENQINSLGISYQNIKNDISRFISGLSFSDVFDLDGVWERAKSIFSAPIVRIINLAKGLFNTIMTFIKEAVLKPLAEAAKNMPGYDLGKAVLGKDPITGETVPQTADALIGGFMKLIGQEEVYENIKKGNAVERALTWFKGAMQGVMAFVAALPQKIINAFTSIKIDDFLNLFGLFDKVVRPFANFVGDFISWAGNQVLELLKLVFEVVAPAVLPYVSKAKAAFSTIIKDPIKFLGHLAKAGKLGFQKFSDNILTHLKTALIRWITGPLGDAGVYIPKSFGLMEIIKLVLSVLGLTWQNIRGKLVKFIPEPILVGLEKTAGILVTLVTEGPAAAWEQIKTELTELKDQLIEQVSGMITTEIVKAAVGKLVMMFNPFGAFIQAIQGIMTTVSFFVQKIKDIAATVAAIIDSIAEIAEGRVESAAQKVEGTLVNGLTLALNFLAKYTGLDGIPAKITGIIKKIRNPIDKGLDKIVGWLEKGLKGLAAKAKKAASKVMNWWKEKTPFTDESGKSHNLYFEGNEKKAVPMVASKPKSLKTVITSLKQSKDSKKKAAAEKASPIVDEIYEKKSILENPETTEAKATKTMKDIVNLMKTILPSLSILLSKIKGKIYVGTFGSHKEKGITGDHIPSLGAIVQAIKNIGNKKEIMEHFSNMVGNKRLTVSQIKKIPFNNNVTAVRKSTGGRKLIESETIAVFYESNLHRRFSRTYGSKNKALLGIDAGQLRKAVKEDFAAIKVALMTEVIDGAIYDPAAIATAETEVHAQNKALMPQFGLKY
ncbi:MAG: hypothetical protein RLZZ292_3729 [Bacteroidota bacterium]|jgi:hypothetical protein